MPEPQKSTVLILGAGGRLGRLLRRAWAATPPAGLDLQFQSRRPLGDANSLVWAPGDDPRALPAATSVIALWGQTAGDAAALALNSALARESRAVALATEAQTLFHLSTAAVYGPAHGASEATPPAPVTAYGAAKLAMEDEIGGFRDPGLHHVILRLANVVGADSLAPGLLGPDPVTLDQFADGAGPLRSYIGPGDLAHVLAALAQLPSTALPGLLNVAAPAPVAMRDLVREAGKHMIWRPAPKSATQEVTLDAARLRRLLPQVALSSNAQDLIADWRATNP